VNDLVARSLLIDGLETSYVEAGPADGPPVVLLHDGAWGGSAVISWSAVIPYLTDRYRVVAPDLLGFGRSAKAVRLDGGPYGFRIDHVVKLVDALGIDKPLHVVGASFGGSLALNMLPRHWRRIASVMSISGTGGPWRTVFGRRILGTWDGTESGLRRVVEVLAEPSDEFDLDAHVAQRLASARLPGHYRAMTAPGIELPEPLRTRNDAAEEWPSQLAGIPTPVVLVAGTRDGLVEPDWPSHLEKVLINCTVTWFDGLHSPNLDAPSYTARLIEQTITSVGAR